MIVSRISSERRADGDAPAVDVRDVSVRYRVPRERIPTFKEFAIRWLRGHVTYEDMLAPSAWLSVLPVDRATLIEAARLQSGLALRLPDAIHVATAVASGCAIETVRWSSALNFASPNALAAAICRMIACIETFTAGNAMR